MTREEIQTLAALHAVGALDGEDRVAWQNALAAGEPEVLAEQAAFRDAAVTLAASASLPPGGLPPAFKHQVLARIRNTPQAPAPSPATAAILAPGFRVVSKGEAGWTSLGIPGGRCKRLSVNPDAGYSVMLIEMPPGGRLPEHPHVGHEEIYVLSGDLQTEGRRLGPGDFLHADPGTVHHALYTEHGCTALLVVPLPPVR